MKKSELRHIIREEIQRVFKLNETLGDLTPQQSEELEGIVISNRRKSEDDILKIAKKSRSFKDVDEDELMDYILDIKAIYR